jgi:hypothetical protein
MNLILYAYMQVLRNVVSPCVSPNQRETSSGVAAGNMTARSMVK